MDVESKALGTSPSDFEVAAVKARVHGLDDSEDTQVRTYHLEVFHSKQSGP